MTIVPGTAMFTIGPNGISKCRPTRIRVSGTAMAFAPTAAAAHREAAVEARAQRDRGVQRVRGLRCPPKGGCAAGCQQGRTMRLGYGMSRSPAKRWRNGWHVTAAAYYVFIVFCHCPG